MAPLDGDNINKCSRRVASRQLFVFDDTPYLLQPACQPLHSPCFENELMSHRPFQVLQRFFPRVAHSAGFALLLSMHLTFAGIDSGGGFEALGNQTIFCSIGEPFATDVSMVGSKLNVPGQVVVLYTLISSPGTADADQDGLPDDWENQYFGGTDASGNGDADGDGANNIMEFLAGTIPTNPSSVLRLSAIYSGGNLSVQIPSVNGREYRLHFSADLQTWSYVRSLFGNGSTITHTFRPANDDPSYATRTNKSKYFIRIEILNQP